MVYVLDTTVLIEDPDIMYKFTNGMIVIPLAVIKELDGLKKNDYIQVAQAARRVSRTLDRLGSYNDLSVGVKLSTGGTLKIYTVYKTINDLNSNADNMIVGTAIHLKSYYDDVTLFSADMNMRTVARLYGVKAEPHCEGTVETAQFSTSFDNLASDIKEPSINTYLQTARNSGGFIRRGLWVSSENKKQLWVLVGLLCLLLFFLKDVPLSVVAIILGTAVVVGFFLSLALRRHVRESIWLPYIWWFGSQHKDH